MQLSSVTEVGNQSPRARDHWVPCGFAGQCTVTLSKINKVQLKTIPYFNPGQIFALSFTEVLFSRVAEKVNLSTCNSSHVFIFLKVAEMEIIGLTNPVCLTIKSFADC